MTREQFQRFERHQDWVRSAGKRGKRLQVEDEDFSGADLTGMSLAEAILPGCWFEGAVLKGTDFYAANLASASFRAADLAGAILVKANLDFACLAEANLREVKARKATFYESDLRGADVSDSDLRQAVFDGARLEQACFSRANLAGASLAGVHLRDTQLTDALGLENLWPDSADVGPDDAPHQIFGKELRVWLINAGMKNTGLAMIDDRLVDRISIIWKQEPPWNGTDVINCPRELNPLHSYFRRYTWSDILSIAEAVQERSSLSINESGFLYPHDQDPWEEPFEGVQVYNPLDEALISEAAFHRLVDRFFSALIAGATAHQDPVIQQPWWERFVSIAEELHKRVQEGSRA